MKAARKHIFSIHLHWAQYTWANTCVFERNMVQALVTEVREVFIQRFQYETAEIGFNSLLSLKCISGPDKPGKTFKV